MHEKAIVLERSIRNDLRVIGDIYADIGTPILKATTDEETLIVLAYRLHNLYNAFENIFLQIATVFENQLDDQSHWHTQLLQRMQLDLTPIRPSVIDATLYDKLDELRRFRHLFRSSYTVRFDVQRIQLVWQKALELREIYVVQLEQFLSFLKTLQ